MFFTLEKEDLDISERFLSRETKFDKAVIIDLSYPDILSKKDEILNFAFKSLPVILDYRKPGWNRIIEDNTIESNYPIFILHFIGKQLAIIALKNIEDLDACLDTLFTRHQRELEFK